MTSRSERRRHCSEIAAALASGTPALVRRETPRFDGLPSRYGEAALAELPGELRRALARVLPPGATDAQARLRGFMRGDYLLPCAPDAGRTDEVFVAITEAEADGLTLWANGEFRRHPSRAGEVIVCAASAWYWVSPVQGESMWMLVAPRGEEGPWSA